MLEVRIGRVHRILIAVVVTGAVVIAAIGFAGSFSAVRDLAEKKGFGSFSPFFPIGVDAGIVVLLALDLLLTWIRIPFPLLRQTAWLLTAATIAFNGAAAWPDPLGVGMHAVIPVLFVVTVEAARHAVGRVADITADKHMEGVRLSRWLLAFPSTFRLWRRMKLWELRSYDEVIRMEQDRLVYETRLRARYGRAWRRKAPVEALMPLRLARYGVPLTKTAPSGLAAVGLPADSLTPLGDDAQRSHSSQGEEPPRFAGPGIPRPRSGTEGHIPEETPAVRHAHGAVPASEADASRPGPGPSEQEKIRAPQAMPAAGLKKLSSERRPVSGEPGVPDNATALSQPSEAGPHQPHHAAALLTTQTDATAPPPAQQDVMHGRQRGAKEAKQPERPAGEGNPTLVDRYYQAWAELTDKLEVEPTVQELADHLWVRGMAGRGGGQISPSTLRRYRMGWRIYRVWAQHLEAEGSEPSLGELAELCAQHDIRSKGGHGNRLGQAGLADYLIDFRRRHAALGGQEATATK
ncbi:DUF2637 domain-containing protein (plasmid) [Streptomyces sp. NBC_01795]|nr:MULTISPECIES: DUF2637 domain-containing protein [unclassified Streptomyces]WSS46824.1 DUF2637 domain-containing protein [Streptomyces sp. NBC_01187]WSA97659.1 DUF2637 domain-containing protein [Streptomyces sp. NBC_01795]WSB82091.1 DUF2637 domain-containing protein [Streptomyces sp. NBC_01775]WSS18062.1 DUF2637 domain-containing protein [Streptomyces sp. NBC_01186]WSS46959.1 DUF2637 domain-containing protein [Streptomyces sp. NBC_01187]